MSRYLSRYNALPTFVSSGSRKNSALFRYKLTNCYYFVSTCCTYLLEHIGNVALRNAMILQVDKADILKPLNQFVRNLTFFSGGSRFTKLAEVYQWNLDRRIVFLKF